MSDIYYHLAFSHFAGIGPMGFNRLIRLFGGAKAAYEADTAELSQVLNSDTLLNRFIKFRTNFDPVKKLQEISGLGIKALIPQDASFPFLIKQISDVPICLYVKGDIASYDFMHDLVIAVVGTRKASEYGLQVARTFSGALAQLHTVIVSGLAVGIDAAAHQGALDANGKTIAILGCGVDIKYPAMNAALYDEILKNKGLVISEFPPGMIAKKGLFIARNRLISGISRGVLIVEGASDSGALITGRYAAQQGREVYAPPVPLSSQLSQAPNYFLKQGATLVTCPGDIIEDLKRIVIPEKIHNKQFVLSGKEEDLVSLLNRQACNIDGLVRISGMSLIEIMETLSNLELKNIIEKTAEGNYRIRSADF